jgi:hypothetical protein
MIAIIMIARLKFYGMLCPRPLTRLRYSALSRNTRLCVRAAIRRGVICPAIGVVQVWLHDDSLCPNAGDPSES